MITPTPSDWRNKLYFGDNLPIMRGHIPDESVDLIYLDPPFNSNATYNVLFREHDSSESAAQIQAFDDTWHWSTGHAFAGMTGGVVRRLAGQLGLWIPRLRSE